MIHSETPDHRALRFRFGRNWARFLKRLDEHRIAQAEDSLREMLAVSDLKDRSFLDVGAGSGLFSLAARRLGASVHSFDYDRESVECVRELKTHFFPDDPRWRVEQGDALDESYLAGLGVFDVVYAWGVLHHTGDMWRALDNVYTRVAEGGWLFVALYNDQRWLSRYWKRVKRIFNRGPVGRVLVVVTHAPYFVGRQTVRSLVSRSRYRARGMDAWRDIIDWLGGYPFEVARPEQVLAFFRSRGFTLERMKTVDGRHGCNEFVFRRSRSDG